MSSSATPEPESEHGPDLAHAEIGVVHATSIELTPFLDRCERVRKYTGEDFVFRGGRFDHVRIAFAQCGMGPELATRGTHALIDAHSPEWVISAGFSGALLPGMRVGDIVVGDAIAGIGGQLLNLDVKMPADPAKGLYVGRLLMVESVVRTVQEKQELAKQHEAIAVDMESLSVARVCQERKKKFLAVRVISDDLSADLPPEILTVVGSTGTLRLGAALGAVWKRPGSIKDMWQLRESANSAASRLATFLEGIIGQLVPSKG